MGPGTFSMLEKVAGVALVTKLRGILLMEQTLTSIISCLWKKQRVLVLEGKKQRVLMVNG